MKKIQIFIDHDIVIRHFIHSNAFRDLLRNHQIQFVFPAQDDRVKSDIQALGLNDTVTVPVDRHRIAKLRYLAQAQLLTQSRKNKQFAAVREMWRHVLGLRSYLKLCFFAHPLVFPWFRRRTLARIAPAVDLERAVKHFAPDLILHPSVLEGLFINDLIAVGNARGIPVVGLMNSWDNPSTKAQVTGQLDWLAVWGEQTKRHAVSFLGMDPARIVTLGAAQFEAYRQAPFTARKAFLESLGLPTGTHLIVYAGSSKGINEMGHLSTLNRALADGLLPDCHVLYRPHPWRAPSGDELDFFEMGFEHVSIDPHMIHHYNSPKQGRTGKIHLADYAGTHVVLSAADLVISNMSTILLEAALHGKPTLCLASREDEKDNWFLGVTLRSIYFVELLEHLGTPRCRNTEDLPLLCQHLLETGRQAGFAESLQEKTTFFVDQTTTPYPRRLLELLGNILEGKNTTVPSPK